MEKLNNPSEFSLILKYALKDLSRNYHKISSIIITLFISLFILSAIFTIEDSLKKELNDNAKALLGGDLEIDYNRNQGNLDLVNKVKEFATVSQMIEFSTMLSTTGREKNKSLFTRIKTVDEKYPLYGNVVYEPIGAYERMQKEPNTILINESLSKTLNIKINELVRVQDKNFKVIGIIKSVPDVSGFVAFGDWALAGKQTLEKTDKEDTDTTKTDTNESFEIDEASRIPTQYGNVYDLIFNWRGKMYAIKMFFPKVSKPQKAEVQNALSKIYPGSVLKRFQVTSFDSTDSYIHVGTDDMKEDWQSVNRKDKTDGLSQKAVDAYRRENPGSKLKTAVTTKPSKLKKGSKSAKRRKSFCSRMKGMKKRLTSAKTARDPDSRINKALRRWNC